MANVSTASKVRRSTRGILGSGALIAFLTAIAEFKTWQELLVFIGSGVGGGALLWALVEAIDWLVGQQSGGANELNSDFKHYFVLVGAVLLPFGIYGVSIWLGWVVWNTVGFLGAVAAARQIASTIHWESEDTAVEGGTPLTQPVQEDDDA
jgi:hypothetical protein